MKFVSFLACSLVLFVVTLALDARKPTQAQGEPTSALAAKVGQVCFVEFRNEDDGTATAKGLITQVSSEWVVLDKAHRVDYEGFRGKDQEIWIPRNLVTSVSFGGDIKKY